MKTPTNIKSKHIRLVDVFVKGAESIRILNQISAEYSCSVVFNEDIDFIDKDAIYASLEKFLYKLFNKLPQTEAELMAKKQSLFLAFDVILYESRKMKPEIKYTYINNTYFGDELIYIGKRIFDSSSASILKKNIKWFETLKK